MVDRWTGTIVGVNIVPPTLRERELMSSEILRRSRNHPGFGVRNRVFVRRRGQAKQVPARPLCQRPYNQGQQMNPVEYGNTDLVCVQGKEANHALP